MDSKLKSKTDLQIGVLAECEGSRPSTRTAQVQESRGKDQGQALDPQGQAQWPNTWLRCLSTGQSQSKSQSTNIADTSVQYQVK